MSSNAEKNPSTFFFTQPWFWAWAVAFFVFPLIWVGGLVTTHDAGMAVPDWPGTYGYNLFLYPITAWIYGPFDLLIEHGHRLLGAFVGMLAIVLCIFAWMKDQRPAFRIACLGLLVAICMQGLLGGMRVVQDARTLAMIHGCGGALVFAFATAIAIGSSSDWKSAERVCKGKWLNRWSWTLLAVAIVQLFVGANLRHSHPDASPVFFMATVHTHLLGALAVLLVGLALAVAVRTRNYRGIRGLRLPANAILALLIFQICLGFSTWVANYALPWTNISPWLATYAIQAKGYWESLIVTAHQASGSLLISFSVWMVCRIQRRQA